MVDVSDAQPAGETEQSRGPLVERFASTGGRVIGIVALLAAGLVLANLATSGRSLASALVAALAVFLAVVCWMALVRPGVAAYERVLLVRNMASDWEVPWPAIEGAEARQTLRIYTGGETVHAVGVTKSTRQLLRDTPGTQRRPGYSASLGAPPAAGLVRPELSSGASPQDYVADRVMTLARERRTASPGRSTPRRSWALPELALLALSSLAIAVLAVLT